MTEDSLIKFLKTEQTDLFISNTIYEFLKMFNASNIPPDISKLVELVAFLLKFVGINDE